LGLKKIDYNNRVEPVARIKKIETNLPEPSLIVNDTTTNNNNRDMKRLISIDEKLTKIVNDIESKYEDQNRIMKWKYVSTVLDKLFFYIVIIYFIVSFISVVLAVPNFYKLT
jgi:hypothetical protein